MHLNDIKFVVCHSFVFAVATIKISYRTASRIWRHFMVGSIAGAGMIGFSTCWARIYTMWSESCVS